MNETRFPNAAKGVKRIFTAEILGLIGAILTVIGLITGVITLASMIADSATGTVIAGGVTAIFMIGAGVLMIIAFIMNIVGISNAVKDEASFKTALIFVIVGIVGSVISSFFSGNPAVSSVGTVTTSLANLLSTVFVITGIINLADQLHNGAVSNKGNNVLKMIIAVNALGIIANLIVLIMGGQTASIIAGVIAIVAAVLSIVQYIMYLSYLSKAKKMLNA